MLKVKITKQHVQGLIASLLISFFLLAALIFTPAGREWLVGLMITDGGFDTDQLSGALTTLTTKDKQFEYTINEDGYATITKYKGNGPEVTVPMLILVENSIFPRFSMVTAIGKNAFSLNGNIIEVTLPSSVTTVGPWAFSSSTNLKTVNQNSLQRIEESAFNFCISLTNFNFNPELKYIGVSAFENCRSLQTVNIPSGVTEINAYAFLECFNLTSVTLPEGVTTLHDAAFASNLKLTSISLPKSLTTIGNSAFNNCKNLTSVKHHDTIKSIEKWAFSYCSALTSISEFSSNGPLTRIGEQAFLNCSNLVRPKFGEGVTIAANAFEGCK